MARTNTKTRVLETPANIVDSKIMFGTSNGYDVTHFVDEFTGGLYKKFEFKMYEALIGIGGDAINIWIKVGREDKSDDILGLSNVVVFNKKARLIL